MVFSWAHRNQALINLVTGGAGFVGSHLTDRLMQAGEEVICLDNYFTGRKTNISKWIGNPRFELIRHDVTDPIQLECDRIWHLACPASPVHYQFNPIKTAKTSFLGTYNMLGLARRVGARLLLASTSEVYGDPEVHPQPESYRGCVNTIGIRSCYDEGKRIAETLCFDYQRMHEVEIRVMRIFNTYGPRMLPNDGRVVSNFIVQALKGSPLTLYGDGSQTRSFCFVDDLVEGMIRLMNGNHTGPMNIGNPEEFTIQEYVLGTRYYFQFFFDPIPDDGYQVEGMGNHSNQSLGRLELMSIDRRDEANVDEFYKLGSLRDLRDMGLEPSFVVTGNTPAVLRESLLPQAFKLGEGAVASSMELEGGGKGMIGPFCLETIVYSPLPFVFRFTLTQSSARSAETFSMYTSFSYGLLQKKGARAARKFFQCMSRFLFCLRRRPRAARKIFPKLTSFFSNWRRNRPESVCR